MKKLSILTMVTNPDERQEKWREALANYCRLADEVIVVNGGKKLEYPDAKVKFIDLFWPEDWDWEELPLHLNAGKRACTGDWILKLDIDQIVHETEHKKLRDWIERRHGWVDLLKLIKMNFVAKMRWYSKGSQPILFRNQSDIGFGFAEDFPEGDLCMPIRIYDWTGPVPRGKTIKTEDTDCHYWNFSYTFRTEAMARERYLKMCHAFLKYYKSTALGKNDEEHWQNFIQAVMAKWSRCKFTAEPEEIPSDIRMAILGLKPEEKGFNIWGRV